MENWSKDHTLVLISCYEECACLYDPTDINFCNRVVRNTKYEYIIAKLKEAGKVVTTNDIKSKLKTLQNQLSRERKKVLASKKSGTGFEDLYEPKLWCFDKLQFLIKHTQGTTGISNINVIIL